MVDIINVTELANVTLPLINTINYLIGGVFGIYLISSVTRFFIEIKKLEYLKSIENLLKHQNKSKHLPYSRNTKSLLNKVKSIFTK